MILMDKTPWLGATMVTFLHKDASETAQYSLGPWIGKSRGGGSGSSSPIKIDGIKREKWNFFWLNGLVWCTWNLSIPLWLQITAK